MKKDEAETEIRALISQWRRAEHSNTPASQLHSSEFISWLRQNSPGHLRFRTTTGVGYDIDMWFDDENKQNWTR
jgi:hypothetical protein